MIVEERMAAFINSLDPGNAPELEELEAEARRMQVPVIRRELQSLLKTLLALQKPGRILEVGTAIGFSALFMSEYAGPKARITTIENYEKRIPRSRFSFWPGMQGRYCRGYQNPMTLCLWMRPRGSIFISCRKFCDCLRTAVFWFPTMCCRRGESWIPALRWNAGNGLFTVVCGNICMS